MSKSNRKIIAPLSIGLTILLLFAYFYLQGKKPVASVPVPTYKASPIPVSADKIVNIPQNVSNQTLPESWWGGSDLDQTIFGISAKDGTIIQILPNGTASQISKTKVLYYSYNHPTLAYVVSDNEVHIYDTNSKKDITLPPLKIGEIVGLSVDNDTKTLYLLGNYSTVTRATTLYSLSVNDMDNLKSPEKIADNPANKTEFLNKNYLLLFEFSAGKDQSSVWLYDTTSKTSLPRYTANNYSISPNRTRVVFVNSNQSAYIDTEKQIVKETALKLGPYITWKDDNILISGTNTNNGIRLVAYDVAKDEIVNEGIVLGEKKISGIIGYNNGNVIARFDDNSVGKIPF